MSGMVMVRRSRVAGPLGWDLVVDDLHRRIKELEAGLRECERHASDAGNDIHHTDGERMGARMVGAKLRAIMSRLLVK